MSDIRIIGNRASRENVNEDCSGLRMCIPAVTPTIAVSATANRMMPLDRPPPGDLEAKLGNGPTAHLADPQYRSKENQLGDGECDQPSVCHVQGLPLNSVPELHRDKRTKTDEQDKTEF